MKQLVWNRGEKKDNKNEEILKPVSKTIVPGNEQCQSFQKKFQNWKLIHIMWSEWQSAVYITHCLGMSYYINPISYYVNFSIADPNTKMAVAVFFWINNESMISLNLCGWTLKACHSYCKPIIKLQKFKDQQCVVQCAWVRVTFIVVVSWNESRQTQRYAAEQRFD